MHKTIKIAALQHACSDDKEKNLQKAEELIKEAAAKKAQVIVLQELFAGPYFCDIESYDRFERAESFPNGEAFKKLESLSKELGVVIVGSIFEKRAPGIYHNSIAVFDADGSYLGRYRKQHIPDDPGYYEKFYFTPGDNGYKVFSTQFGKIGTLICWDQWYPEAARITSLMGADILVYPTAIGWAKDQDEITNQEQFQAWRTIQKSHAIANGIHVIAANRIGWEGDMKFWGGSFISNPFGRVLTELNHEEEGVLLQEIDIQQNEHYRTHWPFLRDRRVDTYSPLLQRFIDHEP